MVQKKKKLFFNQFQSISINSEILVFILFIEFIFIFIRSEISQDFFLKKNKTKQMEGVAKQLFDACVKGNAEEIKQLLETNPQLNINCQDYEGQTPFFIACEFGRIEVVKLLLNDQRVNKNQLNKCHQSPFWIACWKGYIEVVKLLLKDQEIDVNETNVNGWTPLFSVCFYGSLNIVKLLLKDNRVDVNKGDQEGKTACFVACQNGRIDVLECILASGRDMNLENRFGKTLFDFVGELQQKGKWPWENDNIYFEKRKNWERIAELLKLFKINPSGTRFKLRKQLRWAGNIYNFYFFFFKYFFFLIKINYFKK